MIYCLQVAQACPLCPHLPAQTLNALSITVSVFFLVTVAPTTGAPCSPGACPGRAPRWIAPEWHAGARAIVVWLPLLVLDLFTAVILGYVCVPQVGCCSSRPAVLAEPHHPSLSHKVMGSMAVAEAWSHRWPATPKGAFHCCTWPCCRGACSMQC